MQKAERQPLITSGEWGSEGRSERRGGGGENEMRLMQIEEFSLIEFHSVSERGDNPPGRPWPLSMSRPVCGTEVFIVLIRDCKNNSNNKNNHKPTCCRSGILCIAVHRSALVTPTKSKRSKGKIMACHL